MNIREAIYKAGEGGKIRLGEVVLNVSRMSCCFNELGKPAEDYTFTAEELVSLNWEAQVTDWTLHADE